MINVAIPIESRISQKIFEKFTNYVDLKIELWRTKKVFVVPFIIGAPGSVLTGLSNYSESLDLPFFYLIAAFQQTLLVRTSINDSTCKLGLYILCSSRTFVATNCTFVVCMFY